MSATRSDRLGGCERCDGGQPGASDGVPVYVLNAGTIHEHHLCESCIYEVAAIEIAHHWQPHGCTCIDSYGYLKGCDPDCDVHRARPLEETPPDGKR